MRRLVATVATVVFVLSIGSVVPAHADHCKADTSITECPYPISVVVVEGVGQVCDAVAGKIEDPPVNGVKPLLKKFPGYKCKFRMDDPTWVSKPVSPWNPNPDQGLYWPGVGPGGDSPTVFDIGAIVDPPRQGCVSNVGGGPGCQVHAEGFIEWGRATQDPRTGAHCGSSHGEVTARFTAADGSLKTFAHQSWDQSAATILVQFGEVDRSLDKDGREIKPPSGQKAKVIAVVSARGVGGAGNCGISQATSGFQVEGFSISY